MDLLLGTILLRPYVFIFLTIYLLGASAQFGYRTALIFLPLGYLLAFASEFSSIHWGFPYGDYFYIPSTADRELWVFGVPFMDSLSYVFLAACSYATALFLWCPFQRKGRGICMIAPRGVRSHWIPWILGGLLMVFLDIVIDPVTLQGDRWFLGKIYGYASPGPYFGVPLSNFGGWFLVALVLIKAFQWLDSPRDRKNKDARWSLPSPIPLWGPVLYLGILAFNLIVTFWVGEVTLGIVGSFLTGTLILMGGTLTFHKMRFAIPVNEEAEVRNQKANGKWQMAKIGNHSGEDSRQTQGKRGSKTESKWQKAKGKS